MLGAITALFALIAALVGFINNIMIKEIHVLFNSRMDQLLEKTRSLAHAEGIKEERDRIK